MHLRPAISGFATALLTIAAVPVILLSLLLESDHHRMPALVAAVLVTVLLTA